MPLFLYNTLTRRKEMFVPLRRGRASLYSCGPTVYNYAHIGNLRTYVFVDTLKRALTLFGYQPRHIMNITDVGHLTSDADEGEDKLERGAAREKKTVWQVAAFYTESFKNDIRALNIIPPVRFTKATGHIRDQIKLIKTLERKGFVYDTPQAIYFDTARLADYGKLMGKTARELKAGAGARGGTGVVLDPHKRSPEDFVLWFKRVGKYADHAMHWPSPWGDGFPGWHIECSAMSMRYLGETIDLHTGGIDHVPVHHTNEIAQSESATGKPFVRYFLHGNFLNIDVGDKMAKSGENFITLALVRDRGFPSLALRYLFLNTHYRSELAFSWKALEAAAQALQTLAALMQTRPINPPKRSENLGAEKKIEEAFYAALKDDLNTPRALSVLWSAAKSTLLPLEHRQRLMSRFDAALGLGLAKIKPVKIPPKIRKIAVERELYRANKQFMQADGLRSDLNRLGYEVDDTAETTCLRPLQKSPLKTRTPSSPS